jgi:hypothetical protein
MWAETWPVGISIKVNNKVRQSGITVDGDNAGRDINNTTNIYENTNSGPSLILAALYEKYQTEKETKTHTDEFIEDILDYYVSDDTTILRDLERKLTEARREDLLGKAKTYKHSFRQKLERFRLFPSAQKIYSLLLGQALTRFDTYIEPYLTDELNSAD